MKKLKPVKVYLSEEKDLYDVIYSIFGFYPGNIFLYKLAFRHKSAAVELFNGTKISNERLEYLGDAVLSLAVADYLFKKFPFKDEGFLTEMRSKMVSRAQLNTLAVKLGLDHLIETSLAGSTQSRSMMGDALEAFLGAIYLDKGYEFSRKIIVSHIIKHHMDINELETLDLNFKSKLLEWTQKTKKVLEFHVVEEAGFNHRKRYQVEALIDQTVVGNGTGTSIKEAEQKAAEEACNHIFQDDPGYPDE
ncbi:MAG: ribonuclease III [Bacteroidales bacterium]|nr:ribonuclease III [Lentimicrobiaceae bacterium]MDD5693824.1 ribonuclease III [Bacteroidales bacterium]